MKKELAHSFNVQLSQEIKLKLKNEQEKLLEKFEEKRFYDSSPHLAIATKFMDEATTRAFAEALSDEFKNDAMWELEFSDLRPSETGDYIFLHLNDESRQKLLELHERVFRVTKNIGLEIQSGNKFRHFAYDPHISIIKLELKDLDTAFGLVSKDFLGIKMPVMSYEITRQADDEKGFSNFPVICEINLK